MRKGPQGRVGLVALLAFAGLAGGIAFAGPAAAQGEGTGSSRNDLIVLTGRLVVPEGEVVDTAVIFDGPAVVDGAVSGSLVVFNGSAEISGTVGQDVVVFNGGVVVAAGARVGGDIVSRRSAQIDQTASVGGEIKGLDTRFNWVRTGLITRTAWWFAYSVSSLVLGLLLLAFVPRLDAAVVGAWRSRRGAAVGVGLALFFLAPIAAVFLLATVVALPLGLFFLLALALLYTVGYVAAAHLVGRRVLPTASRVVAFLAGLGLLRALALIPVVGGLAWVAASVVGLGVLAVAARRRTTPIARPSPRRTSAIPPPPPMPPPT